MIYIYIFIYIYMLYYVYIYIWYSALRIRIVGLVEKYFFTVQNTRMSLLHPTMNRDRGTALILAIRIVFNRKETENHINCGSTASESHFLLQNNLQIGKVPLPPMIRVSMFSKNHQFYSPALLGMQVGKLASGYPPFNIAMNMPI